MQIPINVIGYEETRKIAVTYDKVTGNALDSKPVPDSEQAHLDLELPSGHVIRAEVPYIDFLRHIAPLITE